MYLGQCLHLRTQVNKDAHHFHKTSRKVRENISCVHIPVFFRKLLTVSPEGVAVMLLAHQISSALCGVSLVLPERC